jgi:plastocyanin
MKRKLYLLAACIILTAAAFGNLSATTITVQAGPSGSRTFSPSSFNATVGDTVKWIAASAGHTTESRTIPAGAPSWTGDLSSTGMTFIYKITVAGSYSYACGPHEFSGMVGGFNASPSGIEPAGNNVPDKFELSQNYPNPFNPNTTIKFSLPQASRVTLKVYDMLGNVAAVLVNNENMSAGSYNADLNGITLSSGVYFYRLETENFTDVKRMTLVK